MKWHLLQYQQKVRFIGIASVIILLFSYQYGFKNTWLIYDEYNINRNKLLQLDNSVTGRTGSNKEEKFVTELIKRNLTDSLNSDKKILSFVTSFCKDNSLLLIDYPPLQITENKHFDIATRQITVQGVYDELINLLFELENGQSLGKLCSVSFKSAEDISSGKITIKCTLYLQNLITKK